MAHPLFTAGVTPARGARRRAIAPRPPGSARGAAVPVAGDLRLFDLEFRRGLPGAGRSSREMADDDVAQHRAVVDAEPGIADPLATTARRSGFCPILCLLLAS
jgi:hypothetical protein